MLSCEKLRTSANLWAIFASSGQASLNCTPGRLVAKSDLVLTVGLQGADLIRVRRAQVTAARLVRRFYRVGGITREQQW